jgi:hypothetical protein
MTYAKQQAFRGFSFSFHFYRTFHSSSLTTLLTTKSLSLKWRIPIFSFLRTIDVISRVVAWLSYAPISVICLHDGVEDQG